MNCKFCGKPYTEKQYEAFGVNRSINIVQCDCEEKHAAAVKNKQTIELYTHQSGIPDRYYETIKNFVVNEENRALYDGVMNYEKDLISNIEKGIGLMILGLNGTGKTWLSCHLLLTAIKEGIRSKFYSFRKLATDISSFKDTDTALSEYIQEITAVPFACIDDLGIGQIPEWRKMHFGQMIDEFSTRKKARIFTSNKTIKALNEILGYDVMSRIKGMCKEIIIIGGEDMR